jgi:hypothetical protein
MMGGEQGKGYFATTKSSTSSCTSGLKISVLDGRNETVAHSASAMLFILLLVQNTLLGMDTFSTPWIANLTEEPVEFVLTDSRDVAGNFQLRPGTILQYTVGPQEILTFSVTRASGQVQSYDEPTLQRLRSRAGSPRDYLLILPDSVEFVSKAEFKSRLSEFKRQR